MLVRIDLSSSLKVVEMHTWSSDWKPVIVMSLFSLLSGEFPVECPTDTIIA